MDLLEDVGISLSPEVDIGQIEGAYVMGLGLYTSEELVYDDNTGKILTNRTWVTYSIRLNSRRSLYTGWGTATVTGTRATHSSFTMPFCCYSANRRLKLFSSSVQPCSMTGRVGYRPPGATVAGTKNRQNRLFPTKKTNK